MPRIGIELNNVCNLDCGHCFRDIYRGQGDKSNLFLKLDLLESILQQAKPFGYKHVGITGGEPPMHPKFGEACELITRHGYSYHFLTNGRNFPKTLEAILPPSRRAGLNGIAFSLDGATAATHDAVRGAESYQEVISSVAACQSLGIDVVLISTVNRANRHEIDQFALLGAHLKVKRHVFSHQNPTQHNMGNDLALPLSEWRAVERDVARVKSEFRHEIEMAIGFHTDYFLPRCAPLSLDDINVDYKGRLTLCCQISNYRDGDHDGEDVVADLNHQPLGLALHNLLTLVKTVHTERLEMALDPDRRAELHYPCLVCLDRFAKTNDSMVKLQGLSRSLT